MSPEEREKLRLHYLKLALEHEKKVKKLPYWKQQSQPLVAEYSRPIWMR